MILADWIQSFIAFMMGFFMIFSATLKAVPHCLQKEQDLRVGDLGLRGTINMGGTGSTFIGLVHS